MQQAGPAHGQRLGVGGALLQNHQHMHAAVDLRVMQGGLRHAEQRIDFRQQFGQGAAVAQHLDKYIGTRFHQGAGDFLPAALGGQCLQLTGLAQLAHQRQGFLGHPETERCIAGGKTGDAQHPQRVFGEGRGDMAQQARVEVALAAVGVVQLALGVFGHGVDGQIAANQVVFDADLRAGEEGEAAVALAGFALGAGEGVFLAGVRVEKHREVVTDRAKALGQHLCNRGANHQPVDVADRLAEQAVAHGAADFVNLHGNSLIRAAA